MSKSARPRNIGKKNGHKSNIEVTVDGELIEISPDLEEAVHRARNGLLAEQPQEMTTTEAASFLDVSRPLIVKLIKQGELSCRMVGTHRRIPTSDLLKYREKMFVRAKDAADEITRISEQSGLYESKERPLKKE
jgi:excisionase family DNA binding protein